MRHGEASATTDNSEQQLTPEGRAGIESLATQLQQQGINIKQVFHSKKARAQQTAEIMARQLAPDVTLQLHPHIQPNDQTRDICNDIQGWQQDTLIVSHMPFIPSLLEDLTRDPKAILSIPFTPGTVVCLSQQKDTPWQIDWSLAP